MTTEPVKRFIGRAIDGVVKADDVWLFAERLLYVDWLEERAL